MCRALRVNFSPSFTSSNNYNLHLKKCTLSQHFSLQQKKKKKKKEIKLLQPRERTRASVTDSTQRPVVCRLHWSEAKLIQDMKLALEQVSQSVLESDNGFDRNEVWVTETFASFKTQAN